MCMHVCTCVCECVCAYAYLYLYLLVNVYPYTTYLGLFADRTFSVDARAFHVVFFHGHLALRFEFLDGQHQVNQDTEAYLSMNTSIQNNRNSTPCLNLPKKRIMHCIQFITISSLAARASTYISLSFAFCRLPSKLLRREA